MLVLQKLVLLTKPFEIKGKVLKENTDTVEIIQILRRQNVINFYDSIMINSSKNGNFSQGSKSQYSVCEYFLINFDCIYLFGLFMSNLVYFSI
jgi:hypothetical protein